MILAMEYNLENRINNYDQLSYSQRYCTVLDKDLEEMKSLVSKGHKIKWSANGKWCEVGGHQFNISKAVWNLRVVNPKPEEEKRYYGPAFRHCIKSDSKPVETIEDFSVDPVFEEPGEKPYIPMWIIATLRRFGNVAFKDKLPFNLDDLKYYDLEVDVTYTKDGIVLERKR